MTLGKFNKFICIKKLNISKYNNRQDSLKKKNRQDNQNN